MKFLPLFLTSALAASGCMVLAFHGQSKDRVVGSGRQGSREQSVGHFSKVVIEGGFKLDVARGKQSAIRIEGDDNVIPIITLKVRNDTLTVSSDKSYSTNNSLKVSFSLPVLEKLDVEGSCDAKLHGLQGNGLELQIDGSGKVIADGRVDKLKADISGSGKLQLFDLKSRSASIVISGSGNVDVTATDSIAVQIDGSGNIRYKGNPHSVKKAVNGSGTVRPAA